MRSLLRVLGVGLAAVLVSGCGLRSMWADVPPPAPVFTPAPEPSAPGDERTKHPYAGTIAAHATCRTAGKALLSELQDAGGVGGAVTYPVGARIRANAKWWTVAVARRVAKNSDGYTGGNVPDYEVFVTNSPSYSPDQFEEEIFTWRLLDATGDAAAARALACARKLPVPRPKPEPGSPETYTGRLGTHATCAALSGKQLARFQDVGRVGGAITYPRGVIVKANLTWWTVAVALQVNPNGEGLTKDNVPATALFVTDRPSLKASTRAPTSFPITYHRSDAAARKALACLDA